MYKKYFAELIIANEDLIGVLRIQLLQYVRFLWQNF